MHACTHACTHPRMPASTHARMHARKQACKRPLARLQAHMHTRLHTCMHVCKHARGGIELPSLVGASAIDIRHQLFGACYFQVTCGFESAISGLAAPTISTNPATHRWLWTLLMLKEYNAHYRYQQPLYVAILIAGCAPPPTTTTRRRERGGRGHIALQTPCIAVAVVIAMYRYAHLLALRRVRSAA